ncbi:DUF2878 domain-containing protein [Colwelliaceae bacterium 6471]
MWLNLIGFNLIWLGLVLLGNSFILVVIPLLILHFYYCPNRQEELRLMVLVVVIGTFIDSMLIQFGIFSFAGLDHIPYWLITLWLAFACTLSYSLHFLARSRFLQCAVGCFLAPLSYLAGERLGAVSFQYSTLHTYFVLAVIWGHLLVLFFTIQQKIYQGTRNHD